METPDFKKIAGQLRNPNGQDGLETAHRMEVNNGGMIRCCIDHLPLSQNSQVLEIGFGGGGHVSYLLEKARGLQYSGVDISATMTGMAIAGNPEAVKTGIADFKTVLPQNGYVIFPYATDTFDQIFTVNTIYFWDNAPAQAAEVYRVLKPGGTFITCFATEEFMKNLPFTQYDFNLYSAAQAKQLLEDAGFKIQSIKEETETVMGNAGPLMERTFILLSVTKQV